MDYLRLAKQLHARGYDPARYRKIARDVMEKKLGRKLSRLEYVHHIDGDVFNFSPDNLELASPGQHKKVHKHRKVPLKRRHKPGAEAYFKLWSNL